MLNNGGLSGSGSGASSCGSNSGMGTPTDMYPNGGSGGPGGTSPNSSSNDQYPPPPNSNNFQSHHLPPHQHHQQQQQHYSHPHHQHHPPSSSHNRSSHPHQQQSQHDGMLGHHSGGICSQMGLSQQGPCTPHDSKLRPCGGCGEGILDRVLFEAWDRYWHHSCLKCALCNCTLADAGPTCFSRDGMMLCRPDYIKMFGNKGACRGCGQYIPADQLVMRAGSSSPMGGPPLVFHVQCFTCSKCCKALAPGDRYSVLNGALLCESDALKVMKQNGMGSPGNAGVAASNGPTTAPRKGKVGRPRRSRD